MTTDTTLDGQADHTDEAADDDCAELDCAREGSDARLQILLQLADRPEGATLTVLASCLGMCHDDAHRTLRALQAAQRVDCEWRDQARVWFIPLARASRSAGVAA